MRVIIQLKSKKKIHTKGKNAKKLSKSASRGLNCNKVKIILDFN